MAEHLAFGTPGQWFETVRFRIRPGFCVYCGLLGAQYVIEHEDIEADVFALAEAVDGSDPELVADLVTHKRESGDEFLPENLESSS